MNEYNDRLAIRADSEQKVADFRQSPQQRPVTVQVLGIEGEEGPEDYANDLDPRFEDRGSNEMSRFTFSPKKSRFYYDETSERTWFNLASLPTQPNVVLKPGIEKEQRLSAEAFKRDLISMLRKNSALSERDANLALDQRLAHLTRELDEELEKNLQDFTQNNPDTRQNIQDIQKQPVSEEKPAPNSPNRHRFMALKSMNREGMSQVGQANYPFS